MICCRVLSIIVIKISSEVFLKNIVKVMFILKLVVKVGKIEMIFRKIDFGKVIWVVIVLMKFVVGLFGLILGIKVF